MESADSGELSVDSRQAYTPPEEFRDRFDDETGEFIGLHRLGR